MIQTITPTPNIPCQPGWCLAYVNEAYGVPKRYGSATAAWNASPAKHRDRDFPPGVWVPLWFWLPNEPNGHVVLREPGGAIWSTSTLTNVPYRHPDLADLFAFYAFYGMPLTYLGWTEDVEGTPVLSPGLTLHGTTITPLPLEEEFMSGLIDGDQAEAIAQRAAALVVEALNGHVLIHPVQAESIVQATTARTTEAVDSRNQGKLIDRQQADDIARAAARYTERDPS